MWKRFYLLLFVFGLLLFCCGASLQWNASIVDSEHAAPTGYRIHRGPAPGVYDWQIDVGNVLQWPIPDDLYGEYYWSASAYNASGSSGYSNEVYFTRDAPPVYVGAVNLRASKLHHRQNTLMASDSFTGENDTALATHDSNWSVVQGGADAARIYDNGVSQDTWNEVGFRYTGSNGNTSQIVVKPNSGEKCAPAVRMGATTLGYTAHFSSLSGGNYTYLSLYKNGSWQAWESGTWSASADHTVRIVASGTSSPVTVSVYVDESLVIDSWSDSSSPYTTGLSGIHLMGDGSNDHAFGDDWTDGDTGGASAVPANRGNIGMMLGMSNSMWLDNDFLKPVGGN